MANIFKTDYTQAGCSYELLLYKTGTSASGSVTLQKNYKYILMIGDAYYQSSPTVSLSCNSGTLIENKSYSGSNYQSSYVLTTFKVYEDVKKGSIAVGSIQYNGTVTIIGIY